MPDGDLASLVLEAAKKERAKDESEGRDQDAEDSSMAKNSVRKNKAAESRVNGTEQHTSISKNNTVNGHLSPPFEWNHTGSDRTFTASPEPVEREDFASPSHQSQNAALDKASAKKSAVRQPPSQGRKLSSQFQARRTSTASREKHRYTSQSSNDYDAAEEEEPARRVNGRGGAPNGQQETAKQGSASSSQLRGPFSRLDSSRGQSYLASQKGSTSSSREGSGPGPSRRKSTGGYDSRRQSMSTAARKFVGFFADGDTEEMGDEEARAHDETNGSQQQQQEPRRNMLEPPREVSRRPSPRAGHATPSNQSQGPSRSNSYGFGSFHRRRASTGEPDSALSMRSGEGTPREGVGAGQNTRPGMNRGQTDGRARQARNRWDALRQRLKQEKKPAELEKGLTGSELITDLSAGMMSVMMLKMAFDRDEHNQHRIPVLLNYLKLRITDSVYPFHNAHAIFRIELEYGDGLLKWVIYRELRDFVNLHTHYRVANVTHAVNNFPPFPKVSLPYFNLLKKESREKNQHEPGKAEFARLQRDALENYLLRLVRAVMFRPEANRLCKFLELSAMSINLAIKGGKQGKQGYLRVLSSGASRHKRPGFHPIDLKRRHEPKWFIVRESYIVSVDEVFDTKIWDVFFVDSDFSIERPKRLYRQGIGLFSDAKQKRPGDETRDGDDMPDDASPLGGLEGISGGGIGDPNDPSTTDDAKNDPQNLKNASAHTFYIKNSERKVKLVAKSERQMDQFIASIEKMAEKSIWAGKNRFGSFAPIRMNVAAQWLVDGRDYYWNLSRAILLAKHSVYIHDWWLSPELYLRRPPAENGRWRLDRLLQKKAEEGVQIFVIVYNEVSNDFTPVDSQYTKHRLTELHPNIYVQRSPSHAQTRTLLWSHHEKMCVIDETIGFMGGLDLCFGRWDTPSHSMVDDGPAMKDDQDLPSHERTQSQAEDAPLSQVWPGKDYANSRVSDFHTLTKPFEDMYDRRKVPREPWHDIGLQIIGQPARDLCRHFCQRWNLLLRTKNHRRFMPFLLPAPDFTAKELDGLQLSGTCEAQICRSAGPWSIGTPNKVEHSIQTAYIKAIQLSDHFVYIENQFFITSTYVVGTAVENNIGNALVARIQQAHAERKPWRAIVVMPLEPGYPMPVDHPDAGSVRLIMECQFNSISRGENSIFARLRRDGIDPNEYISFYGLRTWARMQEGNLATSDIYIHAKCMVVDDRIAIIGSANINERSQRGDRDSELACVIRDTDMIDSTMAGKPYKVGRFAHTLRVRLMREHLGIDVDAMEEEEANMDLLAREPVEDEDDLEQWDPRKEQGAGQSGVTREKAHRTRALETVKKVGTIAGEGAKGAVEAVGLGADKALPNIREDAAQAVPRRHGQGSSSSKGPEGSSDNSQPVVKANAGGDSIVKGQQDGRGYASTVVPTLEEKVLAEDRPEDGGHGQRKPKEQRGDGLKHGPTHDAEGYDAPDSGKSMDDLSKTEGQKTSMLSPGAHDTRQLSDDHDASTANLTPEDVMHAHKEDPSHREQRREVEEDIAKGKPRQKHSRQESSATMTSEASQGGKTIDSSGGSKSKTNAQIANSNRATDAIRKSLAGKMHAYSLPTQAPKIDPKKFADPLIDSFYKDMWMASAVRNTQIYRKVFRCTPDDLISTWAMMKEWSHWAKRHEKPPRSSPSAGSEGLEKGPGGPDDDPTKEKSHQKSPSEATFSPTSREEPSEKRKSKDNQPDNAFTEDEIEQMVELLEESTGHLVLFPTRFLEGESMGENFLWSKDRIPPIAIYN